MKNLTETMDHFYETVKSRRTEDVVEHLLRETANCDRVIALEALIRLLVIEHTRARLAEAENNELKRRMGEHEKADRDNG